MTTRRAAVVAGGGLAALLILGAGSVFAQGPTPTTAPSTMMGGQGGRMGAQTGAGMMGGQTGAGMMGALTADQLQAMQSMHAVMAQSGRCDPELMSTFHQGLQSSR